MSKSPDDNVGGEKRTPVIVSVPVLAAQGPARDPGVAAGGHPALPEEARAVRCRDCASCQVRCPNGVRVAERLVRAQDLFA